MSLNNSKEKRRQDSDKQRDFVISNKESVDPQNRTPKRPPTRSQLFGTALGLQAINRESGKVQSLGFISSSFVVDFYVHSSDQLYATVTDDVTITFRNIPENLEVGMRLFIKTDNPTITIGTDTLTESVITNDFLDLVIVSSDQSTVTVQSVKKNDESAAAQVLNVPRNVTITDHTDTTIKVSWDTPDNGSLENLLYDVQYSTSSAETNNTPDSPITNSATKDLTAQTVTISGLTAATAYYIWVRSKNSDNESAYVGPIQTNTDGTYTAGDVGFSLAATAYDTIQASWTQPTSKELRFTLKRNLGGNVTETIVNNDTPLSGITNTYDDTNLDPETVYNYIFEVRNEFNNLISTISGSATTLEIPTPTVAFVNVGARIKFTVTLPADVYRAKVQWSTGNAVDADGEFTTSPVTRNVVRPIGSGTGELNVDYTSEVLLPSTVFYGHAKLAIIDDDGPYSTAASVTTSSVSPPSRPTIDVTSPASGQVRIKVRFNDNTSTSEFVTVSYRQSNSVGPYTPFESYYRDSPPSDDLDSREDRIEIIRSGFTAGDSLTFRAEAWNVGGVNSGGGDTDNVTVDN